MLKKYITYLIILSIFFCCQKENKRNKVNNKTETDSISLFIKSSKNNNLSKNQKLKLLEKALFKTRTLENNRAKKLSEIAYRYYKLKDTTTFIKLNESALKLAYKQKDSFVIADSHWSFAEYYFNQINYSQSYYHYEKAFLYFENIGDTYKAGRMLYIMALIKGKYRDYTGSEILNIKAIKKFKEVKNNRYLYNSYSHLGLLQLDIKNYDRSIFYLNKAKDYLNTDKLKKKYSIPNLNNLGLANLNKKEYLQAIEYFNQAIELKPKRFSYARLIANKALAKLKLHDTNYVKRDLLVSLSIRDSLNSKTGLVDSKIKLANYYLYASDSLTALKYANEAKSLIKQSTKNGLEYLRVLDLLSNIDVKNSKHYLERYIQYNDSLINIERKTQNKFTRIEFETDEFKEETERLSKQQIYISSISIIAFLIFGFVYFIRIQKNKNEKLVLEAAQQRATEEVYLLTLQQQTKLEKEKAEERNRISRELHDGILGKLFGTRVGLGFLEISDDEATQEQHQNFLDELQDIEKEIRDVSHQLHSNFDSAAVNFTKLITELLKEKSAIGGFKEQLFIDKNVSWEKIDEIIKISIYRIIQESLQNIIKHAKANLVMVNFMQKINVLEVEIKDDGIGFDNTKKKKGIGLKNIEARLKKVNGSLQINSAKNEGTQLNIHIPIG